MLSALLETKLYRTVRNPNRHLLASFPSIAYLFVTCLSEVCDCCCVVGTKRLVHAALRHGAQDPGVWVRSRSPVLAGVIVRPSLLAPIETTNDRNDPMRQVVMLVAVSWQAVDFALVVHSHAAMQSILWDLTWGRKASQIALYEMSRVSDVFLTSVYSF